MNRSRSQPPGPVGREAIDVSPPLREGAVWVADAIVLYAKLLREGGGLLGDVYGGKPGTGGAPLARAWDKRITSMAEAHNKFSRKHEVGAMPLYNRLAQWFADTDPMKRACLDHYILAKGADFDLTLDQMKSMPTYIDLFETKTYSPNLRAAVDEAKKGQPVLVETQVSGQNDALGNFSVHVRGAVKRVTGAASGSTVSPYASVLSAADPGVPLLFEGTMNWTDDWDFDPKMAARFKKGTGRGLFSEFSVDASAALVDGVPFKVTTASVPMKQYSGRFPIY